MAKLEPADVRLPGASRLAQACTPRPITAHETWDVLTWWYTGTGNYQGLSMYLWETPTPGGEDEMMFYAMIFPGKPPTP